ncbi:MAG: hypothetical protein EB027_05190 [Actinobacteria bacterium]|nr:hypothetical protein [Actinomycetota bacterium]
MPPSHDVTRLRTRPAKAAHDTSAGQRAQGFGHDISTDVRRSTASPKARRDCVHAVNSVRAHGAEAVDLRR